MVPAYLPGETRPITQLVERAARAGYDTLCLTVDVPVAGQPGEQRAQRLRHAAAADAAAGLGRQSSARAGCSGRSFARMFVHGMPHFENIGPSGPRPLAHRRARARTARPARLEHVELTRRMWQGRLVLKGILDREDARIARESGVDGVIVSNHGGRQLDGAAAPLRVLPAITAAAGGMTVMMDSGVRRGTDVLKALALGAQFVFVGRPFLYAAAIGGEPGVRHAIALLKDEIHRDMALLGINTLAEMRREMLLPARGGHFLNK